MGGGKAYMHNPQQHRISGRITCIIALTIAAALSACQSASTAAPTPAPNECGAPSLIIGTAAFKIRAFRSTDSNFLGVPIASPNVAFWLAGTEANLVFVIAPDAENLSLEKSLLHSIGAQSATVTWADCTSTTYTLSPAEQASSDNAALPDQSSAGITIFFQENSSSSLSIVRGAQASQQVITIDTATPSAVKTPILGAVDTPAFPTSSVPTPDSNIIQAEISLLDTKASADGKSVQVNVSILNTGQSSFSLSTENVALTAKDSNTAKLLGSEPGLPQSFEPGESKTISFTFAKPSSATATLKIFDVEYDIEGY